MKFTMSVLITVLLLSTIVFPQQNNREFRGTWVITWEYISSSGTVDQKKEKIRKILDDHKKANMTSVFWQVRQAGTAYYPSSYEPWGSYAGGTYPGFDPLAFAVEEAHKRGLEIHAWFNVFASASLAQGAPAQQHPEWICRDQSGNPMTSNYALSPGLPAVRSYLLNVAMEVVRNYDLDGFHLDYIRWNEYTSSGANKSPEGKEALLDRELTEEEIQNLTENSAGRYLYDISHPYSAGVPSGFSSWENWWRWSVTEYVKNLQDSIKSVKPWVRLSVAALGKYNWTSWCGYSIVFQDAALWFNEGYIDQIAGMHYHWTTGSGFYGMLTGSCPQCWSQYIQPGIAAGRHYTVGPPSYILKDNNIWNNHVDIVNTCRTVNWVDGFQFFSYGSWRDKEYWETAKSIFFKRKMKIKDSKFIHDTIPDAPQVNIVIADSLNYLIRVTPPISATNNHWFAVYRSDDATLSVDTDEIVEIKFGNSQFDVIESFNGTQDFNGQYTYYATMFDRYWNESAMSNTVISDPIPSFAPVVAASVPAQGDTVSINTQLKFTFSKTMSSAGFPAAVSIVPPKAINNGTWSNSNKTITFNFTTPLDFETTYTVTIDSLAKDINGKPIDGDGNGIPGDPFVLQFRTGDLDNIGPVVIASFPDSTLGLFEFDADEIITVLFDETVDASTINYNNVILKRGENPIGRATHLTQLGARSLLSVKAGQVLQPYEQYSLTLKEGIKDVYGNQMAADHEINFTISSLVYDQTQMMDDFTEEGNWWQPGGSGSTTGIIDSGTYFGYSSTYYLTGTTPFKSAYINYHWNSSVTNRLLREYLSGGPAQAVTFDTSYILQVFIFGDGSRTRFRFAIDEGNGTSWPNHEVSKWRNIDWVGWRLVEWVLNDPNSVGAWIGNGILDFPLYRMDSFQLKDDTGTPLYGRIYLDNLRIVKKSTATVKIDGETDNIPEGYLLSQNYPNPFNPSTVINYQLPKSSHVMLKVFDVLGNEVATLVNEQKTAGFYNVTFDASRLASGMYIYKLVTENYSSARKMLLLR